MFVGELSLDGCLRPIRGIIAHTEVARQQGFKFIFVPKDNAAQASLIEGIDIIPVTCLQELSNHLSGEKTIATYRATTILQSNDRIRHKAVDFADIHGQD